VVLDALLTIVDRVWTAIARGVHTKEFIFKALVEGRQGVEPDHDIYCSECGTLTVARSFYSREGGQPDIYKAGVSSTTSVGFSLPDLVVQILKKSQYPPEVKAIREKKPPREVSTWIRLRIRLQFLTVFHMYQGPLVVWGKWWLDDKGRTASYRAKVAAQAAAQTSSSANGKRIL